MSDINSKAINPLHAKLYFSSRASGWVCFWLLSFNWKSPGLLCQWAAETTYQPEQMQPLITLTTVNNHTIHRTMLESDTISLNLSFWFQPSVTRTIIVSGDVYQRGICNALQPLLQSFFKCRWGEFPVVVFSFCFFLFLIFGLKTQDFNLASGELWVASCDVREFNGTRMTQISHLTVLENSSAVHFTSECR